MNKLGYYTTLADNHFNISKWSLVVAKEESYGTLHCLCSDTVTNHTTTTCPGNVLDVVMLCHQWLGHMSEKGLKILHDQGMFFGIKSCNLDLCHHYIFGKQNTLV